MKEVEMRSRVITAIALLLTLAVCAEAAKIRKATKLTGTVKLVGTVITGIVTVGGDCGHKYWLALGSAEGKPNGAVGLETTPNGPDLSTYLDRKVHVTGHYELCTGIEITAPFVVAHDVRP
jgi:hypothetical protein